MSTHHHAEVLIIGAGPAGYTAAIYAARASLKPMLIQGMQPGGQLMITSDVENYPGFADIVQGPWLMEQMQKQAEHVGTRTVFDLITKVDFSQRPFVLEADSGDHYTADSVILATGAEARWLGLPSETAFRGHGVSACATCDGFFFRGKNVAVVGGGNTAVEEALYLTNHAASVTLIHRRDRFRAEKILQDRLHRHPKVRIIVNSVVEEILGDGDPPRMTGLSLADTLTGERRTLPADGLFVAIGHDPVTGFVRGQIDLDNEGYIITAPDSTATNIPGVFAAGDVRDKVFRQAVTAAGMGCMAALEAERYLSAKQDLGIRQAAE